MRSRPALAIAALCLVGCAAVVESGPPVAAPPPDATVRAPTTTGVPRRQPKTTTAAIAARPAATTTTIRPPAATAAVVTTTAAPRRDGVLTMAFTGDALWHSPLWRQAQHNFAAASGAGPAGHDFEPMLAPLRPVVAAADLAVCHLETPIAPEGEAYSTFPLYGVPPEVVTAIAAAGFDRCSTASNHSADRGTAGVDRTIAVLEANGLGQSGMARTPAEIAPRVFTVDGFNVSHLSYTYGYNGLRFPAGQEWRSALIDPQRIVADAAEARRLGAEIVIVSLHWGVEGQRAISSEQRTVAQQLTASGAVDLVVGHHTHVLQPIEQLNGVWVLFGLGNMISNLPTTPRWPAATQDGAIAVVELARQPDGTIAVARPVVHPTWVDREHGWVVHIVQPALTDPAIDPWLRGQLERSRVRTSEVLGGFLAA